MVADKGELLFRARHRGHHHLDPGHRRRLSSFFVYLDERLVKNIADCRGPGRDDHSREVGAGGECQTHAELLQHCVQALLKLNLEPGQRDSAFPLAKPGKELREVVRFRRPNELAQAVLLARQEDVHV